MKACAKAAGERLPLVRPPTGRPLTRSFVKLSRLSSQHESSSAGAVNRIYEIKGRIETRPLAICVADVSDISRFALVDHLPHSLLDSLLPGPVTVVLKRGANTTPF
ncbi:hypothetical protein PR202_ga26717 [Eleusine coracana subsp. coracana]|uniref:Threonylcarbamoyl-AMP synthase n=1 Tax=Eleusine coracana subsp. coracana TaxID=191504 RepID=A0AAV5DE23_ELECO|nr:hypothetical protein PR202_ga26717 [Eleusine coracana subsp. coracana]